MADLAPPADHSVLVAMAALSAIEALGDRARPLHEQLRAMDPEGPSPAARYNGYVSQLIRNITDPMFGRECVDEQGH